MAEKMRVHTLAKELNVSSKVILEKCKAEGLDNVVKNHMSTLSAGLYATIREWFSEGAASTAVETSARIDLAKVRKKPRRKKAPVADETAVEVAEPPADAAQEQAEPQPTEKPQLQEEPVAEAAPTSTPEGAPTAPAEPVETVEASETVETSVPAEETTEPATAESPGVTPTPAPAAAPAAAEEAPAAPPAEPSEEPADAKKAAAQAPAEPQADGTAGDQPSQDDIAPAGPQNVPQPAKLKGPRVVRYEAPDYDTYTRRPPRSRPAPATPDAAPPDSAGGRQKGRRRLNPRRTAARGQESTGDRMTYRDKDLAERQQRLAGATGRRIRRRTVSAVSTARVPASEPKTSAKVHEPVRMKEFCAETGLNFMQCFKVLKSEHNILANINMTLPTDVAELLGLHFGIELQVVPARTLLDTLKEEVAERERTSLQPRPPVVTMLGHVDHGKTSLLDAIRRTRVVATEDGGITQHIGASYLDGPNGAVTFLDTPGHEAFTAMRARGAKLTDVVVLVVAADDGLMPQTIEAINHAKSAEVPIVVALNKIDLGEQNVVKIYGQLTEHGLTPSGDWGGDTDVIRTAATIGQGVDTLVDHLAQLSDLLELKADPTVPGVGAVIEAETKTGVGPVVRVLVQEGTVNVGDVVVCGNAFGKVRALLDDHGRKLDSAGPSMPIEVWGLDDVPLSGDRLFVVSTMQRAKNVAGEIKQTRIEKERLASRKVMTLEEMLKAREGQDIPELNVILKADVDGSMQTLKQTLSDVPSDEVKLTIRHAGVGAVTDSDVLLAAACGGLVVAFRVDAPIGVRRMAEQHGVDVRSYRVVYDVSDDIKKALEGLLAPEEKEENRATVEVRELFRVSKIGLVAGCYVTDGTIERNHLARVLRDGVLVREGCEIDSLRRFKDDVKEVRNGMECGIRLKSFDDLKIGDIIEAYEIIKIARTL